MTAELKGIHAKTFQDLDVIKDVLKLDEEKIAELEQKISVLLSCKNCPENDGGFICQKEYEGKCLSQKIQYIKELKEENKVLAQNLEDTEILNKTYEKRNAELKADNDARKFAMAMSEKVEKQLREENAELEKELKKWKDEWQEQVQKATDEGYARTLQTMQLSKAKELLAKWVELFKPKGGNIPPTPIQVDTEQFLKDSEVEK